MDDSRKAVFCMLVIAAFLTYVGIQNSKKEVACSLHYEKHTVEFNRCVHLGEMK